MRVPAQGTPQQITPFSLTVMSAITNLEDERLLNEVVQYITLVQRKAKRVTVSRLFCNMDSPMWRCGGIKVVRDFVSRHASRLALADTGRNSEGGLEVLLVSAAQRSVNSHHQLRAGRHRLHVFAFAYKITCHKCDSGANCGGDISTST